MQVKPNYEQNEKQVQQYSENIAEILRLEHMSIVTNQYRFLANSWYQLDFILLIVIIEFKDLLIKQFGNTLWILQSNHCIIKLVRSHIILDLLENVLVRDALVQITLEDICMS